MKEFLESFFKSFFSPQSNPEEGVKQTGLINEKPRPTDWLSSGETGIAKVVRRMDGDWREYRPTNEDQYIINFDTLSCTSFSALNVLETFLNYLSKMKLLPKNHVDFLKAMGFMNDKGEINFSDRFTAMTSGTTKNGNSFVKVWDAIRNIGLIPEKDLPFGGTSFETYHDWKKITPLMMTRAKKILDFFSINYEWIMWEEGFQNSSENGEILETNLKEAPLHVAVPIYAYHAEELLKIDNQKSKILFDTYPPYVEDYSWKKMPINYAMKAVILPKDNVPVLPVFNLSSQLKQGITSLEVSNLQTILSYLGFMNVVTGYFGPVTKEAVKAFQAFYGIESIGEVGPVTRAEIRRILGNPAVEENRVILYKTALSCVGKDVTPADVISDEVACAESVNAIHKLAFGREIGGGASTALLYATLMDHPNFQKVLTPTEGDIIISPTGYSTKPNTPIKNGHTGIVGKNGIIMSNSSSNGLWSENYNLISWAKRYQTNGGYPIHYFRRK